MQVYMYSRFCLSPLKNDSYMDTLYTVYKLPDIDHLFCCRKVKNQSSPQPDIPIDPNEPTYCLCKQVKYNGLQLQSIKATMSLQM
jgi:hypothetical protein